MATQSRMSGSRLPRKLGPQPPTEQEVVGELRRLIREALREEEHRWTEIRSGAQQALEQPSFSTHTKRKLRSLVEECDRRFAAIVAQRRR